MSMKQKVLYTTKNEKKGHITDYFINDSAKFCTFLGKAEATQGETDIQTKEAESVDFSASMTKK